VPRLPFVSTGSILVDGEIAWPAWRALQKASDVAHMTAAERLQDGEVRPEAAAESRGQLIDSAALVCPERWPVFGRSPLSKFLNP
jgi:hypothetical protein